MIATAGKSSSPTQHGRVASLHRVLKRESHHVYKADTSTMNSQKISTVNVFKRIILFKAVKNNFCKCSEVAFGYSLIINVFLFITNK